MTEIPEIPPVPRVDTTEAMDEALRHIHFQVEQPTKGRHRKKVPVSHRFRRKEPRDRTDPDRS